MLYTVSSDALTYVLLKVYKPIICCQIADVLFLSKNTHFEYLTRYHSVHDIFQQFPRDLHNPTMKVLQQLSNNADPYCYYHNGYKPHSCPWCVVNFLHL